MSKSGKYIGGLGNKYAFRSSYPPKSKMNEPSICIAGHSVRDNQEKLNNIECELLRSIKIKMAKYLQVTT